MLPILGSHQGLQELKKRAIKEIVRKFTDEIATHTVQLWLVVEDSADKAKPWGTAVLVEAHGKHYLTTAAHIMDGIDVKKLAFWDEQDLVQVSGQAVFLSNQAEINKMGDVAVWELSEDATAALLKHYVFLPFDRVKLNHKIETRERYFLLGYPVSKTKKLYKSKTIPIKTMKFFTCGIVSQRKMKHNNLDPLVNFMLDFHRRKAQTVGGDNRQIVHLPDPHGMSGCGLWYLDDDKIARLVGVMIGYNHTDTILIASRIDLTTEIIRKSFDAGIPASTTIRVNWKN